MSRNRLKADEHRSDPFPLGLAEWAAGAAQLGQVSLASPSPPTRDFGSCSIVVCSGIFRRFVEVRSSPHKPLPALASRDSLSTRPSGCGSRYTPPRPWRPWRCPFNRSRCGSSEGALTVASRALIASPTRRRPHSVLEAGDRSTGVIRRAERSHSLPSHLRHSCDDARCRDDRRCCSATSCASTVDSATHPVRATPGGPRRTPGTPGPSRRRKSSLMITNSFLAIILLVVALTALIVLVGWLLGYAARNKPTRDLLQMAVGKVVTFSLDVRHNTRDDTDTTRTPLTPVGVGAGPPRSAARLRESVTCRGSDALHAGVHDDRLGDERAADDRGQGDRNPASQLRRPWVTAALEPLRRDGQAVSAFDLQTVRCGHRRPRRRPLAPLTGPSSRRTTTSAHACGPEPPPLVARRRAHAAGRGHAWSIVLGANSCLQVGARVESCGGGVLRRAACPLRDARPRDGLPDRSWIRDRSVFVPSPGRHSMRIRPFTEADGPVLVELTVETFRPLFEDQIRPAYGEELFALHHGRRQQDYRDEIPSLHDPAAGSWIAVAEVDAAPAGFIAWSTADARPDHGRIQLLAVFQPHRRADIGRRLCQHAIEALRARHRRRGAVPRPDPSALREHRLPQGPDRRLHQEDLTTGPAGAMPLQPSTHPHMPAVSTGHRNTS